MTINYRNILARLTVTTAGGAVIASGCSADQVSAVLSGIEVVTRELGDGGNSGGDVDLGDWLSDQVSDF